MFFKKTKKTLEFNIKNVLKDNPPLESFYNSCGQFLQGRADMTNYIVSINNRPDIDERKKKLLEIKAFIEYIDTIFDHSLMEKRWNETKYVVDNCLSKVKIRDIKKL